MTPERIIQKQMIDFLKTLEMQGKLWFTRVGSGGVATIRKDGSKGYFKSGKAGAPDIIACSNQGKFIGIEVKNEKGKLSPEQKATSETIKELWGHFIVARSVEELKNDLKTLEVI